MIGSSFFVVAAFAFHDNFIFFFLFLFRLCFAWLVGWLINWREFLLECENPVERIQKWFATFPPVELRVWKLMLLLLHDAAKLSNVNKTGTGDSYSKQHSSHF